MRISAAIQHHPSRAGLVPALLAGLAPLEVELVEDPDSDGRAASWRTYRPALERTPAWATHRLIVQDDVLLCDGFVEACERVAACRPDRLVALCVCGEPRESALDVYAAAARGARFAELRRARWVPTVALLWPVELAVRVLEYVAAQTWPREFLADDEIVGRSCSGLGIAAVATVPSLVEHPDVVVSVIGRRAAAAGQNPGRVAALYLGEGDARSIPWEEPEPPPRRPLDKLARVV